MAAAKAGALVIAGHKIPQGAERDLEIVASQSYSGADVTVPLRVVRARRPGPTVLVTAAVHGDEVNGTGIIRKIMLDRPFELSAGALVLVPVVNVLAFERHSRYLPDRRDLNRCFPGKASGSLASRFAHSIFTEVVRHCDYGIDLHTAAVRRTNFPNVRGDLTDPEIARIATAFGCPLVVHKRARRGMLRCEASRVGCPTMLLEAGEVWKIEPGVVEIGVRGVRNVLIELGMVKGEPEPPAYQATAERTTWLRAEVGGLVEFHVGPGELVKAKQPIVTVSDLLGDEQSVLRTKSSGVVLGMTTMPFVNPGDPICHLAIPKGGVGRIRKQLRGVSEDSLHERLRGDLGASVTVTEPGDGEEAGR